MRAPRVTVHYPFAPLEIRESYRGAVVVDIDKCRACGRCARVCPADCLIVERLEGRGARVRLLYDRCASCGECEQVCTFDAIRLDPSFRPGATNRDELQIEWEREGPTVDKD